MHKNGLKIRLVSHSSMTCLNQVANITRNVMGNTLRRVWRLYETDLDVIQI